MIIFTRELKEPDHITDKSKAIRTIQKSYLSGTRTPTLPPDALEICKQVAPTARNKHPRPQLKKLGGKKKETSRRIWERKTTTGCAKNQKNFNQRSVRSPNRTEQVGRGIDSVATHRSESIQRFCPTILSPSLSPSLFRFQHDVNSTFSAPSSSSCLALVPLCLQSESETRVTSLSLSLSARYFLLCWKGAWKPERMLPFLVYIYRLGEIANLILENEIFQYLPLNFASTFVLCYLA